MRSRSGFPGGWNGYPRQTTPATPASSATMLAMRPPIDFPPMTSPSAPRSSMTSRQASSSTRDGFGPGRFPVVRRAAMWGNSNRTVRTPSPASRPATRSIQGWSMGAPAPCASTSVGASPGPSIR